MFNFSLMILLGWSFDQGVWVGGRTQATVNYNSSDIINKKKP